MEFASSFCIFRERAGTGWGLGFIVGQPSSRIVVAVPLVFTSNTSGLMDAFRAAAKRPWAIFHNSAALYSGDGSAVTSSVAPKNKGRTSTKADEKNQSTHETNSPVNRGRLPTFDQSNSPRNMSSKANHPTGFLDEIDPSLCTSDVVRSVQCLDALRADAEKRARERVSPDDLVASFRGKVKQPVSLPDVQLFEVPTSLRACAAWQNVSPHASKAPEGPFRRAATVSSVAVHLDLFRDVLLWPVPTTVLPIGPVSTAAPPTSHPSRGSRSSVLRNRRSSKSQDVTPIGSVVEHSLAPSQPPQPPQSQERQTSRRSTMLRQSVASFTSSASDGRRRATIVAEYVVLDSTIMELLPALLHTESVVEEALRTVEGCRAPEASPPLSVDADLLQMKMRSLPRFFQMGNVLSIPRLTPQSFELACKSPIVEGNEESASLCVEKCIILATGCG